MSGFSADWLALREPVDHASVNHRVRSALVHHLAGASSIELVDLGSGTGSNFRSIAPDLAPAQSWTLLDIDPGLLQIAAHRCALIADQCQSQISLNVQVGDLSQLSFDELFEGADVVTASALFDLLSASAIEQIVESVAATNAVFYTTLTYDGIAAWLPEHPLNQTMREAFNRHQRTDKGFGPAAGPEATRLLATAFSDRGYSIELGASPWVLDQSRATLRAQTDQGWAAAVGETNEVSEREINDWLQDRETTRNAISIVGHIDLLAIPSSASVQ